MPKNKPRSPSPRERLVETARQMFLEQGVPHVGINAVTERAKIARMTLYNNFPSKDALVTAVFEQESELRREAITEIQVQQKGPVEKVLALFDILLNRVKQEGFRGCAFINLAVETAAPDSALHQLVKAHKEWVRDNIRDQFAAVGDQRADILAQQILMLWDGASVEAYIQQSESPIQAARDAARILLQAATK